MVEAVAQFDYKAQEADELTLQKGDVITDIVFQPGGWWEGKLKGKIGMFPDNFVKVITGGDDDKTGSSDITHRIGSGRKCKVLFNYTPLNNDELKLQVNDIIDILDEVEEGWWKGRLRNEVGVFPSNFVVELTEEQIVAETVAASRNPNPSQDENSKPNDSAVNHEDASQSSSRSTSLSTDSDVPVLPPKPVKEVCKVVYPYKAANDDELSLKEGEIITVISKDGQDKGWWRGELNGQIGVFPDNFVELVEEVSKPSRPPVKGISGFSTNHIRDSITKSTSAHAHQHHHHINSPPHAANQLVTPSQKKSLETSAKTDEKTSLPGIVGKKPTLPPPPLKKPQRSPSGSSKPPPATSPTTAETSHLSSTPPQGSAKQSESPSAGITARSPVPSISPKPSGLLSQETSPLQSTKPPLVGLRRTEISDVDGSCLSVSSRSYSLNHSNENNTHNEADIDLDCIGRTAMLTHPTASRVRAPRRRPPSSISSKDDAGGPGLMNGNAELHMEKQGGAAMSLMEELKMNYAKKQSLQGRTQVMINHPSSGGGDATSPEPSVLKPPGSTGVVFRNLPTSAPRPQSMYSGEKMSPNPRPLPSLTPTPDTIVVSTKQWTELNDKILRLESTVENQQEQLSKTVKELTAKVSEITERVLQMQLDVEKIAKLVTQV